MHRTVVVRIGMKQKMQLLTETCLTLLHLGLGCVINEQCVQRQAVWKNEVANIVASYA
jgi:hypothetical protein